MGRHRHAALAGLLSLAACSRSSPPNAAARTEVEAGSPGAVTIGRTRAPLRPRAPGAATAASSTSKDPPLDAAAPVLPPAALTETYFKHYGINPTIDTEEESISSFALDVDTASYTLARAYLDRGEMPEESAIRVEEFLNAIDYRYPLPEREDFALYTDLVPSGHRNGYYVLHVGLRAREVAGKDRAPANLVFVVDVSSSMALDARLRLVQDALASLTSRLGPRDRLALVSYGSTAEIVLEPTAGDRTDVILAAIDKLAPAGSTDVDAGLRLGYELATKGMIDGGINRVLLFSDGVVTSGPKAAEELLDHVAEAAQRGVNISTLGVGVDNYDDVLLEQLADRGNGNYEYLDRLGEAERVLVRNLTGTLQVIARDAKLQLEFDAASVARYRLLGYENRGLSSDAFASENTDAGEIGPGHAVTALYELQFRGEPTAPFGRLRLRYRQPHTGLAREVIQPLAMRPDPSSPGSDATRCALVVAALAEKLRGSYWVRDLPWRQIQEWYLALDEAWRGRTEIAELGHLIDTAARIDQHLPVPDRDVAGSQLDFDRMPVLQ
ncbi:MAG: von Willebrand factor type A domain-containing protein [Deltaproteobacteria bacterium]|nr:von Willebrand factor type A domain-containing protein [Deltaproteobacteria bacterium]